MVSRDILHEMIESLPTEQLHTAAMALSSILKPDSWDFLDFAPLEDEEISEQEMRVADEAHARMLASRATESTTPSRVA